MSAALLGPKEMAERLGISASQFYRLQRQGAFERFRVHPALGRRRYSADLVDRWQRGEVIERPSMFGRKRA